MSLEEFEKKLAELDELQAETENAHVKLKAQMAELEKLQAETENAHAKLIAQMAELKERGEEKPEPPHPRWKPMDDNAYYYIYSNMAHRVYWGDNYFDKGTYSVGNVFKTEEAVKFAIERLKVLAEMREWAGHHYDGAYIYYHRPSDEIMINWDGDSTNCFGDIRFKCVDDAENCIKAVGADRIKKYYFNIPEDNSND